MRRPDTVARTRCMLFKQSCVDHSHNEPGGRARGSRGAPDTVRRTHAQNVTFSQLMHSWSLEATMVERDAT